MAWYLLVRHHSAVELIDRAVAAGLVARQSDSEDARAVRIALTPLGQERLEHLAASHLEELGRLTNQLHTRWAGLDARRYLLALLGLRTVEAVGLLPVGRVGQVPA